jgi:hypothetical protein
MIDKRLLPIVLTLMACGCAGIQSAVDPRGPQAT